MLPIMFTCNTEFSTNYSRSQRFPHYNGQERLICRDPGNRCSGASFSHIAVCSGQPLHWLESLMKLITKNSNHNLRPTVAARCLRVPLLQARFDMGEIVNE